MKKRIKKIFGYIQHDLDVIVIKNSTAPFVDLSFFYVTGFEKGLFEQCVVLIYPNGDMEVLTSQIEKEGIGKTQFEIFENKTSRNNILRRKLRGKKIGVNYPFLSHRDFIDLKKITCTELIDIGYAIQKARLVKDIREIKYIKKACEISSNVANNIRCQLKEGISEQEIASELISQIHRQGGTMAFDPIVAFGTNAAYPHYSYGKKRVTKGIALFDFGAKYKRYCSDITRTYYYGNPSPKFLKVYNVVLDAQKIALDIIKPGIPMAKVHKEVNAFIKKKGFGDLIHSTGHSLGLSVHDGGNLNIQSEMILGENMVFTIEPGIYIPGFGGVRIEDDVVVQKEGIEILTIAHKDYDRMII